MSVVERLRHALEASLDAEVTSPLAHVAGHSAIDAELARLSAQPGEQPPAAGPGAPFWPAVSGGATPRQLAQMRRHSAKAAASAAGVGNGDGYEYGAEDALGAAGGGREVLQGGVGGGMELAQQGHGASLKASQRVKALLRGAGAPPGVSVDLPEKRRDTVCVQTDSHELVDLTQLRAELLEVREQLHDARSQMRQVEGEVRLEHARWMEEQGAAMERRLRERVAFVESEYAKKVEIQRGAYNSTVANMVKNNKSDHEKSTEESVAAEAARWVKVVEHQKEQLRAAQAQVGHLSTDVDQLRQAEKFMAEKVAVLQVELQSNASDARNRELGAKNEQLESLTQTLREELRRRHQEFVHESTRSQTLSANAKALEEANRRERQDAAKSTEDLQRELEDAKDTHARERDSLKAKLEKLKRRLEGAQSDVRREREVGGIVSSRQKSAISRLTDENESLRAQIKSLQRQIARAPTAAGIQGRIGTAIIKPPGTSTGRSGTVMGGISERLGTALTNVREHVEAEPDNVRVGVSRAMSRAASRARSRANSSGSGAGGGGAGFGGSGLRRGSAMTGWGEGESPAATPGLGGWLDRNAGAAHANGAPSMLAIREKVSAADKMIDTIVAAQRRLSVSKPLHE